MLIYFFLIIIIPNSFFPVYLKHFLTSTNQQTSEIHHNTDITLDLNTT